MTNIERFRRVMKFEDVDRPPLRLDGPWADTWERWYSEGYPRGVDLYEYFGLEPLRFEYAGPNTNLYPGFQEKIISENENDVVKRDKSGRVVRDFKHSTSMPEWLDFPVKNADDLRRIIDEQFDISRMDERWPRDWEEKRNRWASPGREYGLF